MNLSGRFWGSLYFFFVFFLACRCTRNALGPSRTKYLMNTCKSTQHSTVLRRYLDTQVRRVPQNQISATRAAPRRWNRPPRPVSTSRRCASGGNLQLFWKLPYVLDTQAPYWRKPQSFDRERSERYSTSWKLLKFRPRAKRAVFDSLNIVIVLFVSRSSFEK